MAVSQQGSNVVVNRSVGGSILPTTERELVFPVVVDGTKQAVLIEGSLYGRAVEIRGNVRIKGPVVVRGDIRLDPQSGQIQLDSGLTVNGSVNCLSVADLQKESLRDHVRHAGVIIKGDVAVNQNVALNNAVVFGGIRAVNCSLATSLVLGTCIVDEALTVSASSVGGYASRSVTFEGDCLMLHGLGESIARPLFVPLERHDGTIVDCDVRYYPAIRDRNTIMNRRQAKDVRYPDYSRLYPTSDWVQADTAPNPALDEEGEGTTSKWILSIGGRVCDIAKLAEAISHMTQMLKCGFEFEHYLPARRTKYLGKALSGLTEEEQWILKTVCR